MENKILRRMILSSFLMVPVQRITKYPLLLARLLKVLLNNNPPSLTYFAQNIIFLSPPHTHTVAPPSHPVLMVVGHQVTPGHHADRENIREAQTRIEVTNRH